MHACQRAQYGKAHTHNIQSHMHARHANPLVHIESRLHACQCAPNMQTRIHTQYTSALPLPHVRIPTRAHAHTHTHFSNTHPHPHRHTHALSTGTDWYEGAVVMADKVLADFVSTVQPDLVSADYNRVWLRRCVLPWSRSLCAFGRVSAHDFAPFIGYSKRTYAPASVHAHPINTCSRARTHARSRAHMLARMHARAHARHAHPQTHTLARTRTRTQSPPPPPPPPPHTHTHTHARARTHTYRRAHTHTAVLRHIHTHRLANESQTIVRASDCPAKTVPLDPAVLAAIPAETTAVVAPPCSGVCACACACAWVLRVCVCARDVCVCSVLHVRVRVRVRAYVP